MAPIAPQKRVSMRNRRAKAGQGLPVIQQQTNAVIDDSFSSTKKDKRAIKHNVFMSRIEKTNQKSDKKRRRPSKKLVATLESLVDALPEIEEKGVKEAETGQPKNQTKSLKSRPGAMKKKEKLEKMERERFQQNMAAMAGARAANSTDGSAATPANRWTALRAFIATTMEQQPETVKKDTPAA